MESSIKRRCSEQCIIEKSNKQQSVIRREYKKHIEYALRIRGEPDEKRDKAIIDRGFDF